MAVNNQINTSTSPLGVTSGGTGVSTMTTAYAPVCAGTTATGALQVASTGLATSGFILTSNGASALPSFKAPTISVSTTVLTAANVQSMYATPIQLIANQGSNTLIMVYDSVVEFLYNTSAFGAGDSTNGPVLQYGNTAGGAGHNVFVSSLNITTASSKIAFGSVYDNNGFIPCVAGPSSEMINLGIYASNYSGAFTGGGSSTVRITLFYYVLSTTV